MHFVIEQNGTLRCLYTEAVSLASLGKTAIERGSHVEPDASGAWWADLAPVQGPSLGPFASRSEALAAEVAWLETHWLLAKRS